MEHNLHKKDEEAVSHAPSSEAEHAVEDARRYGLKFHQKAAKDPIRREQSHQIMVEATLVDVKAASDGGGDTDHCSEAGHTFSAQASHLASEVGAEAVAGRLDCAQDIADDAGEERARFDQYAKEANQQCGEANSKLFNPQQSEGRRLSSLEDR